MSSPDPMSLSSAYPPAPPGYELLEEIGRGGMGVVWRAHERRLQREVAVKLLREEETAARNRFLFEATVTGQLQHPGIPAVHELGTLPDGRPFLAMKLVKGCTLHELLKSRDRDPSRDRGRFLAIFEQVCHAVGYAHAHNVIHRDLKPGNVMVGAHGEVQVMDWGLAKVLHPSPERERGEEDDSAATVPPVTAIGTPSRGDAATRTGVVLGTLSYMAPEQAGGEIRKLDARSDVFGLGAMLCEILTGRPPYWGADSNAVRLQAVRWEIAEAFARLEASGAEPELIALCKRCLAREQADRPADGNAVAQEVAAIRQAAEERAHTLRDLDWGQPGNAYNAACALSLCIPIVETHEKLDADQRKAAAQFYGDEAMKLLRDAVGKGWKDAAPMQKDSDLDPLRQREDFQELLRELTRSP
ncbi:MAG TPA: serine/threonine-protein kinase [Gemmataceae bacterium]|nr:serine/threonine-protein kinase [Gemmataceae bacterium]